ncbi:MAG TPA: aryl-sulfate sulfotransferase [Polyangiaceae bacterium]|nr:aryl-sulfate sulfotransferase [Polyangiaceae bacterium]
MDVTIEPNPNSVLSAYVSWTTPEPANAVVQFGAGELTWEIEGAAEATEHRVLVIGMRADTEYQIRALSTGASGSFQGDGTFTTGTLPAQIPVATISVHDVAKTQPGWTLMNVQKGDGTNRALSGAPPAAVIYDEEGHPVWYWIHGTQNERGGAISVDPTDVGVLMGPSETTAPTEVDWAGNEVWACSDLRCGGTANLSHHAGKLSNGNYIIMRDAMSGSRISQIFEEHSASGGEPVHTIGVEDAVTPPGGASGDWAHGNSITVDLENDFAYMSFRWLGVIKMQYSTRTMLWHLPASYGAEGMGNMTFVPADSQFSDIHDPEIHDDGTILFFDNGGYTGVIEDGNPSNLQTRAVEYLIDEAALTATLVWEWPGDFETDPWYKEELYVPFWGDADRLANGNVMITAGRRGTVEITPESRIIEVTKDTGEVVWELRLPKDHGVYRAERLYPLPLVRPIQQ